MCRVLRVSMFDVNYRGTLLISKRFCFLWGRKCIDFLFVYKDDYKIQIHCCVPFELGFSLIIFEFRWIRIQASEMNGRWTQCTGNTWSSASKACNVVMTFDEQFTKLFSLLQ